MRAFRISLALVVAVASLAGVVAERNLPGGETAQAFLRTCGLMNGDHAAERAYDTLWSGNLQGSNGAIRAFEDILIADAASPYRWCDLGEALIEAGAEHKARHCLARAVEMAPLAPTILMRAANAYFGLGDASAALKCTSRILNTTWEYDDIIFATYSRLDITTDQVLAEGLPAGHKRPAQAFVRYLLGKGLLDEVGKAWPIVSARQFVDDQLAGQYSNALLNRKRYDSAVQTWTSHFGSRAEGYRTKDYIFNGGFEYDPTGLGFDWRINQLPGAFMDRDSGVAHSGRASLRIQFTAKENVSFSAVRQTSYVEPGSYQLEARVRAAGVTTDEGIGLCLWDSVDPNRLYVTTPTVLGTTDWVLLSKLIVVKPPTRVVEVAVIREPSLRFDSAISGTAWIDDVRLTRVR